MCGFAGFIDPGRSAGEMKALASSMGDTIVHRGPDDAGAWVDEESGIALAHRRLSVVDLSAAGHQPMESSSGRYVIAFNGEIYNHLQLREQLEASTSQPLSWRGHSDTETLLAAFEQLGIKQTLEACVGMFAIVLWDRMERRLTLMRDRFGEKPLYYGWVNNAFVFASELKALRCFPGFDNSVSRESLAAYLRFSHVPAPLTIYENLYKLEPASLVSFNGAQRETSGKPQTQSYWSLSDVAENGITNRINDEDEALHTIETGLLESVRLQSCADVPLGAFLSGGVDSSLIVALMQQQASSPVKSFTIGFEEAGFDETPHAREVATHLETEHHELFVTSAEAQQVIPQLPHIYDEPFADSSQIPTHLVCRAARQHVTVALSGDAGDELFGGYNRYHWAPLVWQRVAWMPHPLRRLLGSLIRLLPVAGWDGVNSLLRSRQAVAQLGDKAHKLAERLQHTASLDDLYFALVSEWLNPDRILQSSSSKTMAAVGNDKLPVGLPPVEAMMLQDSLNYLPNDILCKVDRAAMSVSLETRIPFLDHRVAETAWRLPLSMKMRDNTGKWMLRQLLYRKVPQELIERPKTGFAIPVGQWLRGPLREWGEMLLNETRLEQEGFFNPQVVRETWQQHQGGRYDWTARLWSLLMFQAWLEREGRQ
ncbi:asparagine synthase (glutamine-hydrolyzing) [Solemya velum gill symbiont]|uniref:asparagine synthase (glutamine-hydrolyzing) n=1 Tax=Solemya velum gill symbiont TaxID=2340 RepID=UPI00099716DA|nr:asparagine synthase (glutamine-hydrolyzing) [Solemya velum gill symbiont]OOZ73868.1 asparagine synthase (glutamine-hydrolyzing) [Solemya velum gill symbiont]